MRVGGRRGTQQQLDWLYAGKTWFAGLSSDPEQTAQMRGSSPRAPQVWVGFATLALLPHDLMDASS